MERICLICSLILCLTLGVIHPLRADDMFTGYQIDNRSQCYIYSGSLYTQIFQNGTYSGIECYAPFLPDDLSSETSQATEKCHRRNCTLEVRYAGVGDDGVVLVGDPAVVTEGFA